MRYDALRYFVEIAEQGSINKAAETLYVSQPNLSTAIRNLETDFQFELLKRTNKGIQLTDKGKEIYYYAKRIFEGLDRLNQYSEIENFSFPTSLSLSVNGIFLCGTLFNSYFKNNTDDNMIFNVYEVGIESVLQDVATLKSDLGIAVVNETQLAAFKRVASIKNLEFEAVAAGELLALVGPKSPFYSRESIPVDDLIEQQIIRYPEDYFTGLNDKVSLGGHHIYDLKRIITMNHSHSMINLLKSSRAYILNNKWGARDIQGAGIRAIPVENVHIPVTLMLIKRSRDIEHKAAASFREDFIRHYQALG